MDSTHLDPARSVISKFGGPERVAEITGRHVTRVYRWMYPANRGGTGGIVPHREAMKLLAHARDNKIEASADDFLSAPVGAGE